MRVKRPDEERGASRPRAQRQERRQAQGRQGRPAQGGGTNEKRRPPALVAVRYNPADTAFAIANTILKQRFWPLLFPAFVFMGLAIVLLAAALSFRTPDTIGKYALEVYPSLFLALLALLPVVWIWARSTIMLATTAYLKGQSPDLGTVSTMAVRFLPTAAIVTLLSALLSATASFFFIIPGLYLAVRNSFILPAVLFEGATAFNADNRSADATRGRFLEILMSGSISGHFLGILVFAIAISAFTELTRSAGFPQGEVNKLVFLILVWPVIATFTTMQRVIRYWKYTAEPSTASQLRRGPSPFAARVPVAESGTLPA